MNCIQLLKSENPSVRSRAFHRILVDLQVNPLPFVTTFQRFPNSLVVEFFNGKSETNLSFSVFVPRLIRMTHTYIQQIPRQSLFELCHFFLDCLNHCILATDQPKNSNNDIYYPNTYFEILEEIIGKEPLIINELDFSEILRLMRFDISESFLLTQTDVIVSQMIKNPRLARDSFIMLVQGHYSPHVTKSCMIKLHDEHPEIFFQYFYSFQSYYEENYPQEFESNVLEADFTNLGTEDLNSIITTVNSSQFNQYYGYFSDSILTKLFKVTGNPEQDLEKATSLIDQNSCIQRVEENQRVKAQLPTFKATTKIRQTSSVIIDKKRLASFGDKKGGLGHKSWQRRFLEFYPQNRCIVWKEEPNARGIKGLLVLSPKSTVIFKTKETGHMYKIIIKPGEKQKNYEISFDTKTVAQEWYDVMRTACAELK